MTRSKLALTAGLVVAVAISAPSAASAWAPAGSATVHPGVQVYTEGAQCTANFVFQEGAGVYLGQAAHCSGTGGQTETDGCTSGSLPLGTPVEVTGASRPRHARLQLLADDAGQGRDRPRHLRLQRPRPDQDRPGRRRQVNPSVPGFGGPTGVGAVGGLGATVYSYGNSALRARRHQAEPEAGRRDPERRQRLEPHRRHPDARACPATRAAASSTTRAPRSASSAPCSWRRWPAPTGSATSAKELAYMRANSGFAGVQLVPRHRAVQTEPGRSDPRLLGTAPRWISPARRAGPGGRGVDEHLDLLPPGCGCGHSSRGGPSRARPRCRRGRRGRAPR